MDDSLVRLEDLESNVGEIDPDLLFCVLSNDFSTLDKADERFEEIKGKKIWSTGITYKELTLVINVRQFLVLINGLAKNQVQELRFNSINISQCYCDTNNPYQKDYCGWRIRKLILNNCILRPEFIEHIISPDSRFKSNSNYLYIGENSIEEIDIIECDRTYNMHVREYQTIRQIMLKREILNILISNYRLRIITIISPGSEPSSTNKSQYRLLPSFEDEEFDQRINPILNRNNKGHQLCLSAVYSVLMIKNYRDSVFDKIGRDVIKLVCQLLLDTKGTSIWCKQLGTY